MRQGDCSPLRVHGQGFKDSYELKCEFVKEKVYVLCASSSSVCVLGLSPDFEMNMMFVYVCDLKLSKHCLLNSLSFGLVSLSLPLFLSFYPFASLRTGPGFWTSRGSSRPSSWT